MAQNDPTETTIRHRHERPRALCPGWDMIELEASRTGEYIRTFCILTCPANALVATIHDRMPVIIPAHANNRWLSPLEADPRDLLAPYPAEQMMMWQVSARVSSPRNDDASIVSPVHPEP
ncbi:MAG: SOS response-associated peptidase family protein [Hyphomicrobiales bacterium]|nr:SOS response-associated peptidase family protein [Hyphomicrobiales bacterium]